jgi:polar amino acid transport system permease protein
VTVTLGAATVSVFCALTAGLGGLSQRPVVRALATTYVELFRGTSALVQLFWFYFGLPLVGLRLDALTTGVVVLGLNIGAYGAEVVRGAVQSVPPGQRDAGLALGFSERQLRWRIVLPQALPSILPPAGNLMIELLKASALTSLITVHELTFQGQLLRAATLRTVEVFALVLILYYGLAQLTAQGVRRLERRLARGRDAAAAHLAART